MRYHTPTRLLVLASLLVATPVLAQTPAERASREFNREERQDRAVDAAEAARSGLPATPPAQMLPLEVDRRSLQPDVGRREERGALGTGGAAAPPSLEQNIQR